MFLTREQVIELTGYRMKSMQIRWLRDNGVRFFVARDGHPRVLPESLTEEKARARTRPDFEALRRLV